MKNRIALATYEHAPGLAPDDEPLVAALTSHGFEARPVVWSDADAAWESFDAVVIRSCWDYHLRIDGFRAWLDRLEALGLAVMNSPSLVRWNSDKRYLLDLTRRGVPTIPTMVVERGNASEVERCAMAENWPHVVVKPVVSASGYETHAVMVPFEDADRASVERATSVGDVLVQPFASEVPSDGEHSFIFLDGVFSHATIKRASTGEFRVQTEHGGSVDRVAADPELVAQAARVLEALSEVPLYARVDGIARGDAFLLMELELIEPNLFLEFGEGALERFVDAIVRRLR